MAAAEKRQQMFAVELYKAANEAIDEGKRLLKYARRFQETSTRQRLGKAGHTYLDQVDAILEKFDLAPVSQEEADEPREPGRLAGGARAGGPADRRHRGRR